MKKRILVLLVMVLLLGGTTFAFGYWDNLTQTEDETLALGNGVTLEVAAVATADPGEVLVPENVVMKSGDVDEIVLTYNVALDEAALTALDLSVTASNVEINGDTTYASLVNIDISLASATVNDTNVLVTVTVTLDEPADVTAYDAIINQDITFTLTFEATQ